MKIAPVLLSALASVFLTLTPVAHAAPAAPANVAAAQKSLTQARDALTQAIVKIQKDPPSTTDLDAAFTAVGALKDVIDAGAEFEPKDLDYAKSALAARKEHRTGREYVDQRRSNVHIHNARRELDAAQAKLKDTMKVVDAAKPSSKDFEEARDAIAGVKKTAAPYREFSKADDKFGTYLQELDASLARYEKGIDDKWVSLEAGKHRSVVDEHRKALTSAMSSLEKGRTDAQLQSATDASSALEKKLDEGRALESKDKGYRADAEKARNEVAQSKKRLEALVGEMGLARLKSELEPAYKDLVAASKALKARGSTEEQVAEARTASIVVAKLVEKYQPQADLNREFGEYVKEVKTKLAEVQTDLGRRNLEVAKKDLTAALRNVERNNPTDENFEEAATAKTILEKTLESIPNKRDPELLKPVADARALLDAARVTLAKRRQQVDIQRHRAKLDAARKEAAEAVRAAGSGETSPETLKTADDALAKVQALIDEGQPFTKKDSDYVAYNKDVKSRLTELSERLAARKVVLAATEGKSTLSESIAAAKDKLEIASGAKAKMAEFEAAATAVAKVGSELDARSKLEKQDKSYAVRADNARAELSKLNDQVEFTREAHALRRKTVEPFDLGVTAAKGAEKTSSLRAKKDGFDRALVQYRTCEENGAAFLEQTKALASVAVLAEGTPSTAKALIALCGQRYKETQETLKTVVPLLDFEEGPKASFESGKALLAQGKKSEALAPFEKCISSGRILQNKNPELKEQKFDVGGTKLTLAEVTQQCVAQAKALRK